tara:strand:+ start:479 stop:1075 length:597 start_codon:yes stop_codon:yes gene_type:complete
MTKKKESLNILQRMNAAQKVVSYVQKNKPNGMKYSIVSHEDVTASVRNPLVEQGVIYYPTNMVYQQVGNRTEVFLQVKFCNIDNLDEFILVDSVGYGIDSQDKGPGKAISYAVKFGLLKAMGIHTGDEDIEKSNVDHVVEPECLTAEQVIVLKDLIEETSSNYDAFLRVMEVEFIEGITDFELAHRKLKNKLAKMGKA